MRQIQYVSKYLALAEEGLVSKLECPMDQGPLFANQNIEDEIFLYCLSCDYIKFIGSNLYKQIMEAVNKNG